jgi:hypothetical protein
MTQLRILTLFVLALSFALLSACEEETTSELSTTLPLEASGLEAGHHVLVRLAVTQGDDGVSFAATGIDMEAIEVELDDDTEEPAGEEAEADDEAEDEWGHHGHKGGKKGHKGGKKGHHGHKGDHHKPAMIAGAVESFPVDDSALELLGIAIDLPRSVEDLAPALMADSFRFMGRYDDPEFDAHHVKVTASDTPRILAKVEAVASNEDGSMVLTLLGQSVTVSADLAINEVESLKVLIEGDLDGYDAGAPERNEAP